MTRSPRTPEQAYQGMAWLYKGVDDDGAQVLKLGATSPVIPAQAGMTMPEALESDDMPLHETPTESPERLAYYDRIRGDNLAPL